MPPLNSFQKSCIALAVGQALVGTAAHANTIVVDGTCTLKDAVASANNDAAIGKCLAGSSADVIQMHGQEIRFLSANYGTSALIVFSDITIEGTDTPGAGGGGLIGRDDASATDFRLFDVDEGGSLTLKDIGVVGGEVSGGEGGGGIRVSSSSALTLINSSMSNNAAVGEGGAIAAYGMASVDLQYSRLSGNRAAMGGAIAVLGGGASGATLTANINSFSGNSASRSGGAISVSGRVGATLTNTAFSSNSAGIDGGAINWGSPMSLNVTGGEFSGNTADNGGGALALLNGGVSLYGINGAYNRGGEYGGFALVTGAASLNVSQSSLTSNVVGPSNFPGETVIGQGGAIKFTAEGGEHSISNTTISSNRAADGGSIYINQGDLTILNSTLVGGEGLPSGGEGSAIALYATGNANIVMDNTVIARGGQRYRYGGEYGGPAGTPRINGSLCVQDGFASISGGSGNFFQDDTCGEPATVELGLSRRRDTAPYNYYSVGTSGNGLSKRTISTGRQYFHAPVFDSPLLGAGDVTICGGPSVNQEDQRGLSRPGVVCDSGAVQASNGALVVDTASDNTDSLLANCSLRDALIAIGSEGGEGGKRSTPRPAASCKDPLDIATLTFDQAVFPPNGNTTITLSDSLPSIVTTVAIQGPGKDALIIDGDQQNRIMNAYNSHLYLSDVTLSNGSYSNAGGLLAYTSKVELDSVVVSANAGLFGAGGISSINTQLTINNSTIANNVVDRDGAAGIRISGRGLTIISGSTISGNLSNDTSATSNSGFGRYAGGLYVGTNNLTVLRNSTVSGNSSARTGGGIAVRNGSLFLLNSTISGNIADVGGAGVYIQHYISKYAKYLDGAPLPVIINSIISGNLKGNGSYGMGLADYGRDISLASWSNLGGETGGSREAGSRILLYTDSSVLGDSASTYAEAFYAYSNEKSNLQLGYSFVATSTDVDDNPNPNSTALGQILSPLADNGGMTLTHDLVAASPAIDSGSVPFCTGQLFAPLLRDQIGQLRNEGACDIGSVEFIDSACFVGVTQANKAFTFCL